MPGGWVIVQRRPTYVITRQLTRWWTQLSRLRVSDGSQRSLDGYFSRILPACPRPPVDGPARRSGPPRLTLAPQPSGCEPRASHPPKTLHRALRRMTGMVFLFRSLGAGGRLPIAILCSAVAEENGVSIPEEGGTTRGTCSVVSLASHFSLFQERNEGKKVIVLAIFRVR